MALEKVEECQREDTKDGKVGAVNQKEDTQWSYLELRSRNAVERCHCGNYVGLLGNVVV